MATLATRKLSEQFEEFLKTVTNKSGEYVYRSSISQLAGSGGKSLVVEYEDLLRYDDELAKRLLEEPDKTLESFRTAAFETLRSESPSYADHVARLLAVRIKGIPDRVPLRKVDTSHIDKMIAVSGMVVRSSELRPLMTEAAFVCEKGDLTYQKQDDMLMKKPLMCETCDSRNLELDRKRSKFIDYQILRVQELPEELPAGQLPQFFDVNAEGDIVNSARPGDRVVLTGVMRAVPDYSTGQLKMRLFKSQIDCNHIEVIGKEPEHVQITRDDEALIRSVASRPDAYQKLIASIAPAITGHEPEREAILLLLAGGVATHLPDGTKLRGDINVLFVGDPGCLVADERVVLGNGAIVKIGQVGNEHLQPLNVQVLTGEGGGRRAMATKFHMYRSHRIVEILTESGKSIKGTPNHPLLRVRNENGRMVRSWYRLDRFKVGDRVAVVTGFPCTIREFVRTNFVAVERHKFGPKFNARLPDRMTPQLAAFCGYVLGDGWISNDSQRFGFVVAEPELDIMPMLLSVVKEVFGLEPNISRRLIKGRKVPLHYVHMSNKDIAANLSFLRQKRVPDMVLQSGNSVVSSFLTWLYEADGSVFAKGRGSRAISLKAKDIELLRDVQVLLLRFGIHSRIVGSALFIRRGEDMSRFAKHIGFASAKKKAILKSLNADAQNFGRVHRQRSERIVSISRHGPADVYDIEVPDGHRFIANGIISHNTAKSEMLKFAAQVAPRGLFASGRGSTAAGLSAAVIREKNVFMLEAGVVVLADQGIACIDEFDKMRPEDRSALHEQMEQQIITVAKGGIYATLNARTAILAAANPLLGKYNPFQNLTENIALPIPLLTRFDIIFIIKDTPTPAEDERLASHILAVHRKHGYNVPPPIEFSLLKKYIAYAKKISPTLTKESEERIKDFYLDLRRRGSADQIGATPRTLESLIRLATARARILLRDQVTEEDALSAIALMNKMVEDVLTDQETKTRADFGVLLGRPAGERGKLATAIEVLRRLEGTDKRPVERRVFKEELLKTAKFTDDEDAEKVIRSMFKEGLIYESKPGFFRRVGS